MNREIIFRGYQRELKKWVFGSLINLPNGACFIFDYNNNFEDRIEVSPDSVGQYTGLDINLVRIFEGDILSNGVMSNVIVKWDIVDSRWCILGKDALGFMTPYYLQDNILSPCKIIGNIYENSNLVEMLS